MLDFQLADLYQVETRALKQAVRRNIERFPADFMFELSADEIDNLVSQNVIPGLGKLGGAIPMAFTAILFGAHALLTATAASAINLIRGLGATFSWKYGFLPFSMPVFEKSAHQVASSLELTTIRKHVFF
jgi:hypothetical protein